MRGILFLVATPIGNLEDITIRALHILQKVDYVAAEDTRHTLKLLNHFKIKKPLISYYKQNEKIKTEIILDKIMQGANIALVSDAGTPVISDPGEEVVKEAVKKGIKVTPIPGACAAINALIASGLSAKEFSFIGFLPVNLKEKKEKLTEIEKEDKTLIFYEAPHKLRKTLECMLEILDERKIVLARELTKIHEEFIEGTASELLEKVKEPKGEYVIILEKNPVTKKQKEQMQKKEMTLEELYQYYKKQGIEKKEIIKKIARDKEVTKNEIYQHFIKK